MDFMDKTKLLEDAMRVLDLISIFLHEESEHYVESREVREPLQIAFEMIFDIYQTFGTDPLIDELQKKWDDEDTKKN